MLKLVDTMKYSGRQAAERSRRIITLYVRIMLLSDVYQTVRLALGKSSLVLLRF